VLEVGDQVLRPQTKTTVKPPFNAEPLVVAKKRGYAMTARTAGRKSVTRTANKFKKIMKRWSFFDEIENLRDGRDSDTDDDLPFRFFRREEEVDYQPADQE